MSNLVDYGREKFMKQRLIDKFGEIYGVGGDVRAYFAPGRVNLIGDHTDYNGGHVFACAIAIGTYAVARKREDNRFRFYSLNYPEQDSQFWHRNILKATSPFRQNICRIQTALC